MDQTSLSSVYINLDTLTSSSNEESLDVKKCRDLSVTVLYKSEEVYTLAKSEIALSDNDFPAVSGVRDIRQIVRWRDGPLGGPTRRPAQPDSQQEPSAPAVDPVTGKCRPGKVSRTVSTSPLMLDMTVVCTPDPDLLQPGAVAQEVLTADTVNMSVTGFDASKPLVATPAIVVGQQIPHSTCRNLRNCFRRLDSRPRLPHLRCRGARQRTRRLRFHPTGCVRGTLRTFRVRAVCLMCHHFHHRTAYSGGRSDPA